MDRGPAVTIFRRVYIGAPAETVWPWLVAPERVREYALYELSRSPAGPGEVIEYRSRLSGEPIVRGVVEELVEGRRLAHSYRLEAAPEDPPGRVVYELLRYGERMCCLEVRHEGVLAGSETERTVSQSWDVILSSLKTLVETGAPLPWPTRSRGGGMQDA